MLQRSDLKRTPPKQAAPLELKIGICGYSTNGGAPLELNYDLIRCRDKVIPCLYEENMRFQSHRSGHLLKDFFSPGRDDILVEKSKQNVFECRRYEIFYTRKKNVIPKGFLQG